MVPIMAPKAPDASETFQGISSDIAPNVYKGFGANPPQERVQEKGGMSLRNPVLYPPELQGQKTRKRPEPRNDLLTSRPPRPHHTHQGHPPPPGSQIAVGHPLKEQKDDHTDKEAVTPERNHPGGCSTHRRHPSFGDHFRCRNSTPVVAEFHWKSSIRR